MGNVVQIADALGQTTKYVYDVLNRQIRVVDAKNQTTITGYDFVGNVLAITDSVGNTISYTYDALDRKLTDTNSLGKTRSYGYDAVGDLIQSIDRNGRTRTYNYDVLNRETAENWLDGSGANIRTFNYSYDAVGHLLNTNDPDSKYTYSYDAVDRITSVDNLGTAGVPNVLLNYSYDLAGNLLSVTDKIGGVVKGTNAYTYDLLNRATRLTQSGTGTNNQLLTDGTFNYQYDSEGNRTKRVEIATGKVTEYVWDYRNRLTSVQFKDAGGAIVKTIEYTYDVNDRRIGKKVDGVVAERYVYDGQNIALVFDGAGNQTHRYLYGTGVDQVLADERGGNVVWALADNQGTIRDVIDNGGAILNHINYDSFGKVVSQTNPSVEFRFGYTGREQDTETGLDYYRARYYDAGVGRFISEDPIGFNAGDGNLTRYVGNSPVNATDPSGLIPATPVKPVNPTITKPTGTGFGSSNLKPKPPTIPWWLIKVGGSAYVFWRIIDAGPTASNDTAPPNPNDCKKKCPTRILYRGDSRKPDDIFNSGFNAKRGTDNLVDYVKNNSDSIFIGTSKQEDVAIRFATKKGRRSGYVYIICDPGGGIDVNIEYRKLTGEMNQYYTEQEIAFKYHIPRAYIRGAVPVGSTVPYFEIPNANYKYKR